jgi:hypothetical protein
MIYLFIYLFPCLVRYLLVNDFADLTCGHRDKHFPAIQTGCPFEFNVLHGACQVSWSRENFHFFGACWDG